MEEHKIKVRIGNAEFEATGTEASVQRQFEIFMGKIPEARGSGSVPPPKGISGEPSGSGVPEGGDGQERADEPPTPVDRDILSRAFVQDSKGIVSLKALPPDGQDKAGDALLLILYGFLKVKNQTEVFVTQMATSARQSGVTVDRIDRTISGKSSYFLKAGSRRGGKYQLNNQGIQYAESMLGRMFR